MTTRTGETRVSRLGLTFRSFTVVAFLISACFVSICPSAPTTQPASRPALDPALWREMTQINDRGAKITSLSADFEQRKFTALLRKPLVSSGRVRVKGATLRWDTLHPENSVLLVTDKKVEVYYPAQSTLEVYTLDQRLAELVASPLPRLKTLRDRFSFAQIDVKQMDRTADPGKFLALEMTPTDKSLREHLQAVRVLLDKSAGYMIATEMTDADGDRTVVRFSNVRTNVDVGDLALKLPHGTRVTHPLEGLEGAEPGRPK